MWIDTQGPPLVFSHRYIYTNTSAHMACTHTCAHACEHTHTHTKTSYSIKIMCNYYDFMCQLKQQQQKEII